MENSLIDPIQKNKRKTLFIVLIIVGILCVTALITGFAVTFKKHQPNGNKSETKYNLNVLKKYSVNDGIIYIAKGDIIDFNGDCIVEAVGPVQVGQATLLKADPSKFKCKYVVHAVGPDYSKFGTNYKAADEQLKSAYKNAINEARKVGINKIAFPIISSGNYAPKLKPTSVFKIAITTIRDNIQPNDDIFIVADSNNKKQIKNLKKVASKILKQK